MGGVLSRWGDLFSLPESKWVYGGHECFYWNSYELNQDSSAEGKPFTPKLSIPGMDPVCLEFHLDESYLSEDEPNVTVCCNTDIATVGYGSKFDSSHFRFLVNIEVYGTTILEDKHLKIFGKDYEILTIRKTDLNVLIPQSNPLAFDLYFRIYTKNPLFERYLGSAANKKYARLLNSRRESDVDLLCSDGHILYANKAFLRIQNEKFDRIFAKPDLNFFRGKFRMEFKGTQVWFMLVYIHTGNIMNFIYDGKLVEGFTRTSTASRSKFIPPTAEEVLQVAKVYKLDLVLRLVSLRFMTLITVKNVEDLFALTCTYRLDCKDKMLKWMGSHPAVIRNKMISQYDS